MVNKFMKSISVIIFSFVFANNAFSARTTINLNATDVSSIKVHTTHHIATHAHNYAVLQTKMALPLNCSSLHMNTDANKSSYALITTALVTGMNFDVMIDSAITAPWGDTTICGIIEVYLKP